MKHPIEPESDGPVQRPRGWQYPAALLIILALAALAWWIRTH